MSRFWGGGSDSDSDDEEDSNVEVSENEESNEGSEDEEKEEGGFFDRADSDEDEPDVKRIVRSQRDKRNEAMNNSIKVIKNAVKINDWVAIQDEFDTLLKVVQKPSTTLEKFVTPRAFIRCLVHLEDAIEVSWGNKDKKKMSANNQKGLSSMKQKLRKSKTQYEAEVGNFRQHPVDTDQSEEERAAAAAAAEGDDDDDKDKEEEEAVEETFTAEDIDTKVTEILASRGRRNVNRKRQLDVLQNLFKVAEEPIGKVKLLLATVAVRFDSVPGVQSYLPTESWKLAYDEFNQLLGILETNGDLVVTTQVESGADETSEGVKRFTDQGKKPVAGSLVATVERLDDEFTKSLQQIDPHTTEYIERLRHEADLYATIVRTQYYYSRPAEKDRDQDLLARLIIRRLEHVYYKTEAINNVLEKKTLDRIGQTYPAAAAGAAADSSALVHQLCTFLYKHSSEATRTRALLCHVFHHALHGRYFQARDLLLMSHLQEMIQHADVTTMILFNRAMVQTGLCAFRHGMLKEAQNALQDIHSTGRTKELLAQGIVIQRGVEKSVEQERLERQRQVPFHMHVNLELLECIFLTCSMVLEVPYMAASNYDTRRRIISKPFRRILDISERQLFTGPPENTREHIMQATKALMSGDWEKSIALISAVKIWDLMPEAETIKTMLASKIQRAGVQSYLLSYSNFYDTISLDNLASMFKLSRGDIHGIVSKMIANEELSASLDQVAGTVVLHRTEPTRLQYLALQFTDKAQNLIEINEKILEVRTGNLGGKDDRQARGGDQGTHGQQNFRYRNRQGGTGTGQGGRTQQGGGGGQGGDKGGKRQFNPAHRFQRNQNQGQRRQNENSNPQNQNQYQSGTQGGRSQDN